MIGWLIFFLAGIVVGVCNSERLKWVRGAAGKARDAVLGSRPAASTVSKTESVEVSPPAANKTIEPLKIAGELAKFVWHWRNWIVAGLILFFAWRLLAPVVSFVSCPFGPGILWCADKEKIDANADTRAAEHETDVATDAIDLATRTTNNINRAERAAERGQQDIEDAIANLPPDVSDADFAALDRVYRDAYNGVYSLPTDNPDPDAGGPQPVRRSRADAA